MSLRFYTQLDRKKATGTFILLNFLFVIFQEFRIQKKELYFLNSTSYRLFHNTNLMHNSFNLQQCICYTTILNMFRTARCSSSGGQIVSPQSLVSSLFTNSRKVCRHTVRLFTEGDDTRGCGDTIGPPEDEQRAARNMLRIVV